MPRKGATIAAVALATLLGGACGGSSAPPKVDADALLRQAKATVDAARSAHFTLTSQGVSGSGTNITGGEGDLARPDQLQGTFTVTLARVRRQRQGGVQGRGLRRPAPFQSHYTRTNPSAFGLTDPAQLLDPDHGLSSLLDRGHRRQGDGQERVAGELLDEVTSTVPGSAIPVLARRQPVPAGDHGGGHQPATTTSSARSP